MIHFSAKLSYLICRWFDISKPSLPCTLFMNHRIHEKILFDECSFIMVVKKANYLRGFTFIQVYFLPYFLEMVCFVASLIFDYLTNKALATICLIQLNFVFERPLTLDQLSFIFKRHIFTLGFLLNFGFLQHY